MKLGSSRGMDTKRPRGSERSKPRHELQLTRPSQPPYPWPPEQAQPGVSKPCRTTLPLMPLLCGDNPLTNTAPSKFLRLTDYQLFVLKQWADGKFIDDSAMGWAAARVHALHALSDDAAHERSRARSRRSCKCPRRLLLSRRRIWLDHAQSFRLPGAVP